MAGGSKHLERQRAPLLVRFCGRLRLLAVAAMALAGGNLRAQTPPAAEYEVKAAFLFNTAKYVEWPAQALPPGAPITIGILGDDPFGPSMERLVQGRKVKDRPIAIRRSDRLNDLKGAHIVFITASHRSRAPQICAAAESWNSITVGDTSQTAPFTAINFDVERGRIVFSVNLEAARRAGARISSKLLTLAKAVRNAGPDDVVSR